MIEKTKIAYELFCGGSNCAQAVLGAFCEDYGINKKTAFKIAGGLGSGIRSAEVCGAVLGAILVVGLKHGESKETCNIKTEEFMKMFKEKNGDIICRNLLGCDIMSPSGKEKALADSLFTTKCIDLVVSAVAILEELDPFVK